MNRFIFSLLFVVNKRMKIHHQNNFISDSQKGRQNQCPIKAIILDCGEEFKMILMIDIPPEDYVIHHDASTA